jgi:hypothetical protein
MPATGEEHRLRTSSVRLSEKWASRASVMRDLSTKITLNAKFDEFCNLPNK